MQIACPFCQGTGVMGVKNQSKLAVPNESQQPTFIICPKCKGEGVQEAGFLAKELQEKNNG